jgi:hypothetical protein
MTTRPEHVAGVGKGQREYKFVSKKLNAKNLTQMGGQDYDVYKRKRRTGAE